MNIGKLLGIDIYLDWTLLIGIALLSLVFSPAVTEIALRTTGIAVPIYISVAFGSVIAIILFISVLFHELAHCLAAKDCKIPVERITLMILGGASEIGEDEKFPFTSPKKEAIVAIAGPLASLFFSGIFLFMALPIYFLSSTEIWNFLFVILIWMTFLNLIIAIFNLLPVYPLDGGRIFHAFCWKITKNVKKAAQISTLIAIITAIMLTAGIAVFLNAFQAGWIGFIFALVIFFGYLEYKRSIKQGVS